MPLLFNTKIIVNNVNGKNLIFALSLQSYSFKFPVCMPFDIKNLFHKNRNTIQFNVLWQNDGPGINVFSASNNIVRSNTLYSNFNHVTRNPWAGRGEIILRFIFTQ